MAHTGEYRAHAAECVRLAQQTSDPQSKSSLLDMACAWLALVTQGEKNSEAPTLVYEGCASRSPNNSSNPSPIGNESKL
jgi:hypothetical protein